jgi:hypothetical protein
MSTPPISRKRSYVSTPPTVIVPYNTPPTVILDEPRKSSIFDGPGQNLSTEFDDDDAAAAKDEYLKRKIEYAKEYLDNQMKRHKAEQDARVEETANMVFRLPKKNGGRRSKKAQRKHRKKTSKRKSRK